MNLANVGTFRENGVCDTSVLPVELHPIISIVKEDADGFLEYAYIDIERLFILGGKEKENHLMLRFGVRGDKTLTIARVTFIHRRLGYFSRLIELLTDFGRKEGYEILEIEGVVPDAMENYVKKNGFKQKK